MLAARNAGMALASRAMTPWLQESFEGLAAVYVCAVVVPPPNVSAPLSLVIGRAGIPARPPVS